MAYYTGTGDCGCTGTLGKARLEKNDKLIIAIGDIDELNSAIGVAITTLTEKHVSSMLMHVQNNLFVVGAELAASLNGTESMLKERITAQKVKEIEKAMDELGATFPEPKKFVLPGGSDGAAHLHLARAVCRRAERSVIGAKSEAKINEELLKYLNRLSSFLFVAALHANSKEGVEERNPVY
jgi:cob(I)alamin adenosyltransferase